MPRLNQSDTAPAEPPGPSQALQGRGGGAAALSKMRAAAPKAPRGPGVAHHGPLPAADIQVTGTERQVGGGVTIWLPSSEAAPRYPSRRDACQTL